MQRLFYPLLLAVLLLCGCGNKDTKRSLPDMSASFSIADKNPLGMYTAYHLLLHSFKGYHAETNKKSFNDFYKDYTVYDDSRSGHLFCIFSRQFYPNSDDVKAMQSFVENGNTLLVSTDVFGEDFLSEFHLQSDDYGIRMAQMNGEDMTQTSVTAIDSSLDVKAPFSYFFYPMESSIKRAKGYAAQAIGTNHRNDTSAIVFRYGSGRIIAVANPAAFTNYFLLTRNNYQYLQHILSYIPTDIISITWDNYYNASFSQRKGRNNDEGSSFSAFQELMKQPPMRWAFWLLLLLAISWIINGLIRRQRIIEVIKPNINSSVEFAETIGRLYLLKKDNKNIALKMITYFLEYVRSRYYISTGKLDDRFTELLATKSGQNITDTENLLKTFQKIKVRDKIADTELLELNSIIKKFMS